MIPNRPEIKFLGIILALSFLIYSTGSNSLLKSECMEKHGSGNYHLEWTDHSGFICKSGEGSVFPNKYLKAFMRIAVIGLVFLSGWYAGSLWREIQEQENSILSRWKT